mgnify:CR=1 FL=1
MWKDPTEGDGIWKETWDGSSSININVGWMEENPKDKDDFDSRNTTINKIFKLFIRN